MRFMVMNLVHRGKKLQCMFFIVVGKLSTDAEGSDAQMLNQHKSGVAIIQADARSGL